VRALRFPALLALALCLTPLSARGTTVPPASLSHALRAAGLPAIPSSWAGIWSATDTSRVCDGHSAMVSRTALDTLCAGAAFGPDTTQFQCSGTFTDTDFDITCTGHQEAISETCVLNFSEHLLGARSGDVVTITYTLNTTYTPTLCASLPDECDLTTGTLTRVGSPPPDCNTTPARAESWGRLKLLYR